MGDINITKGAFTLRELVLMALLVAASMMCKSLIAPVANLLTDFIRIPGGSLTAGFSLMFIVIGKQLIQRRSTGMLMATVQGLLAMIVGMGTIKGILVLLPYFVPGIVIDFIWNSGFVRKRFSQRSLCQLACCLGVVSGTAVNNILVFRLPFVAMILFYLIGILSGVLGGTLADMLYIRIQAVYRNHIKEKDKHI